MPISRPVTKTQISTGAWGIPITDLVNALEAQLGTLANGAWTAPTFTNGWVNVGGVATCNYRKNMMGDVNIRGYVGGGTNATSAFTLPVGFRPPAQLEFVCLHNASGTVIAGRFRVNTDGTCVPLAISGASSTTMTWISLGMITFTPA